MRRLGLGLIGVELIVVGACWRECHERDVFLSKVSLLEEALTEKSSVEPEDPPPVEPVVVHEAGFAPVAEPTSVDPPDPEPLPGQCTVERRTFRVERLERPQIIGWVRGAGVVRARVRVGERLGWVREGEPFAGTELLHLGESHAIFRVGNHDWSIPLDAGPFDAGPKDVTR